MKPALPRPVLMLVTEPCPDLMEIVAAAVRGGVNVVQWRDKAAQPFDLLAMALELWDVTGPPMLLIINSAPVWVILAGGDGVQLAMSSYRASSYAQGNWLVGVSVHSVDEAREAEYGGADYIVSGTIYASQSHPDIAPQGVDYLREVCAAVSIPVIAIGGVTPQRVGECIDAGAVGVAVLSPIMRAQDPQATAREYSDALLLAWKAKQCS